LTASLNAAVNVNSVGRREFDVESWGAIYFFTVGFLANPLKLCDVNSSNIWVLIVFIFVEFLSSYLLSARRIQNVRSAPQNARITSYSIHCRPLHDGGGGCGSIFHLFLPISVTVMSNTWPFFQIRVKKMVFSPWWKSVEFWPSIFFPIDQGGGVQSSRWPLHNRGWI
jgi:hypothetical protein